MALSASHPPAPLLAPRGAARRRKPIVFAQQHHPGEELAQPEHLPADDVRGRRDSRHGHLLRARRGRPKAGPAVLIKLPGRRDRSGAVASPTPEMASAIPVSGSTYSYAYHALGEGVAVVIAGCVLLEYGVATAPWRSAGTAISTSSCLALRVPAARGAVGVADPRERRSVATGGLINLPAVILIGLCALLLVRGATGVGPDQHDHGADQARGADAVLGDRVHGVQGRSLRQLLGLGVRRRQRRRGHDLLLLHRPGRRRHRW